MEKEFCSFAEAEKHIVRYYPTLEALEEDNWFNTNNSVVIGEGITPDDRVVEACYGTIDDDGYLSYPIPPSDAKTYGDYLKWLTRCWPENKNGYFKYYITYTTK